MDVLVERLVNGC